MSQYSNTQRTAQSSLYSTNSLIQNELTQIIEKKIEVHSTARALEYSFLFVFEPLQNLILFSILQQHSAELAYEYAKCQPLVELVLRLFPRSLFAGILPTISKQMALNQGSIASSKVFMHAFLFLPVYYVVVAALGSTLKNVLLKTAFLAQILFSFEEIYGIYIIGGQNIHILIKNAFICATQLICVCLYYLVFKELSLYILSLLEYLPYLASIFTICVATDIFASNANFPVHLNINGLKPFLPKLLLTSFIHSLEEMGDRMPKELLYYLAMLLTEKNAKNSDEYKQDEIIQLFLYYETEELCSSIGRGSYYSFVTIGGMCQEAQLPRKIYLMFKNTGLALFVVQLVISLVGYVIARPIGKYFFGNIDIASVKEAKYALLTAPLLTIQCIWLSMPAIFNREQKILRDRYVLIFVQFATLATVILIQYFASTKQSYLYGLMVFDFTIAVAYCEYYVKSISFLIKLREQEIPKADVAQERLSSTVESKGSEQFSAAKVVSQMPSSNCFSQSMENNSSNTQNTSNPLMQTAELLENSHNE